MNSIKGILTPIRTIILRYDVFVLLFEKYELMEFQGNVPVPAFTKPVLLIGRENMNRAVQGDVVVVEVFAESEWKAPGDAVVDQECMFIHQLFSIIF